jgi:hypothetical protein
MGIPAIRSTTPIGTDYDIVFQPDSEFFFPYVDTRLNCEEHSGFKWTEHITVIVHVDARDDAKFRA